jgi:hypothetical protein
MAHFAKLNDLNIVETVLVVDNINLMSHENIEQEELGIQYLKNIFGENTKWVQTSYNSNFRVRLAQYGFTYDSIRDAFIPPKSYPSWILDEVSCLWVAPIPHPNDGKPYYWSEDVMDWVPLIPYPTNDFIPTEYKGYNHYIWNEDVMDWELIKPFRSWLPIGTPIVSYYISPMPYPTDGLSYRWSEDTLEWVRID